MVFLHLFFISYLVFLRSNVELYLMRLIIWWSLLNGIVLFFIGATMELAAISLIAIELILVWELALSFLLTI